MENNKSTYSQLSVLGSSFLLKIINILKFIVLFGTIIAVTPNASADEFENGMSAFEAREYHKALTIWRTLAKQDDVSAQLKIAEMYAKGLGVEQNITQAVMWLNKAVAQGSIQAEFNLGEIYGNGQGIPVDYEKSIMWYRKAAERGYAMAQYKLGVKYFKGEGVSVDYMRSYAWMDLAAKQEFEPSAKYRDMIASVLNPDELKKAKGIAAQLMKKHHQDK